MSWLERIKKDFYSSSGLTPEFHAFTTKFKREFGNYLKEHGATNVEFNVMHFEISGFFDLNGQTWYFNTGDVRSKIMNSMLVRTAKHHKDYTGGANRFARYTDDFYNDMSKILAF